MFANPTKACSKPKPRDVLHPPPPFFQLSSRINHLQAKFEPELATPTSYSSSRNQSFGMLALPNVIDPQKPLIRTQSLQRSSPPTSFRACLLACLATSSGINHLGCSSSQCLSIHQNQKLTPNPKLAAFFAPNLPSSLPSFLRVNHLR